jgi:hypothetical protein
MILEIYDLESLSNLFTYTGYISKTDKWVQYIICPWQNDGKLLYEHLTRGDFVQCGLIKNFIFYG